MEGDGKNRETGQKLFYDTLIDTTMSYPCTRPKILKMNERFAPEVTSGWIHGKFAKSKWQVTNYTTNEMYDNLSFPIPEDFASWKNYNIPNDGSFFDEEIDLRVYDIVDESIPIFSRAWGYNTMFMAMKGRGRYKIKPATMHYGKGYQQLLFDMWTRAYGGLGGFSAANFSEQSEHRGLFWTASNYRNIYSMPKVDDSETVRGPFSHAHGIADRHDYSVAGGLEQTTDSNYYINKVYFAYESSYGNHFTLVGSSHANVKRIRSTVLSNDGGKGVAFYSLSNTVDSNKKAILVKPMGIDIVWLDWFDPIVYDLEVVYFYTNKQQIYFRTIDPSEFWRSSPKNGVGLFKNVFMKGIPMVGANYRSSRYNAFPDIYFRLRKKSNGGVGRLSRSKVSMHFGSDIYPCNFMVKNGTKSV